jgi:diguanylate cyclase (GGDEF)-like protein
MTILIADDEPVSRRLLEATLVRLGHKVLSVTDGADAVATVVKPDGPRFVILDWDMPGMNGPAACREIRMRSAAYVYIMLLTARDRLEDLVYGLEAEADDFLTKPFNVTELGARLRSGERVLQLQQNLLRAQEALRHQATHDHLTGLFNRAMILEHLDIELRRIRRNGGRVSIAIADVDDFKKVNDTHGHGVGDLVLRQSADLMRSVLREGECLGRYGGEEFLLVLPACDESAARQAAERARLAVSRAPVRAKGIELSLTTSFGLACTDAAGHDLEGLVMAADEALYRAKADGRNRVVGGASDVSNDSGPSGRYRQTCPPPR